MPITLIRHTSLVIGRDVCYGRSDIDVAESFAAEANATLSALHRCDGITSSPLKRCVQLAELIGKRFDVRPRYDDRLAEMNFGRWELVPWSQIPRVELDEWANDFLHGRPHGGETVSELRHRATTAMAEIRRQPGHRIVVCHGGVIRALLAKGDQPDDFKTAIDYGGILPFDLEE